MSEASTRQLIEDLRAVVADAEALFAATAHEAGERAQGTVDDAGRYLREHPWQAIAIAAATGVVLGVLLRRR